jgi:hypothetical protein
MVTSLNNSKEALCSFAFCEDVDFSLKSVILNIGF